MCSYIEPTPCWRLASRFRHCQLGLELTRVTDASVGLPSQQPRGVSPLSPPPLCSERGGCALILYNFERKMQRDPFVHRCTGDAHSNPFTNVWGGLDNLVDSLIRGVKEISLF